MDSDYIRILNRILIINYDETKEYKQKKQNKNHYNNLLNNDFKNLNDYDIIIICTQNSLSGTSDHLQHKIKKFLIKNNYEILSKIDGTRMGNRYTTKKVRNNRIRIYLNDNVKCLFDTSIFKESHGKSKFSFQNRYSYTNTRVSNNVSITNDNINESLKQYNILIKSLKINRITNEDNGTKGFGEIIVELQFIYQESKVYSLMIKNTKKKPNSNNQVNEETSLIKNNKIFKINNSIYRHIIEINQNTKKNNFKINNNNLYNNIKNITLLNKPKNDTYNNIPLLNQTFLIKYLCNEIKKIKNLNDRKLILYKSLFMLDFKNIDDKLKIFICNKINEDSLINVLDKMYVDNFIKVYLSFSVYPK